MKSNRKDLGISKTSLEFPRQLWREIRRFCLEQDTSATKFVVEASKEKLEREKEQGNVR